MMVFQFAAENALLAIKRVVTQVPAYWWERQFLTAQEQIHISYQQGMTIRDVRNVRRGILVSQMNLIYSSNVYPLASLIA